MCGWRSCWCRRLVSKAPACSRFHGLDTPSLSQSLGLLSTLLISLLYASIPPQRGPRGAFRMPVSVREGAAPQPGPQAQRARARKQEHPGGLLLGRHMGSLPCFRSPAFLPGYHHSCKALMSLEAQRTSCAGWELLCQERGSCRSGNSWATGAAQSLCSHFNPEALSAPWSPGGRPPVCRQFTGLAQSARTPPGPSKPSAPAGYSREIQVTLCRPALEGAPLLGSAPLISQSW